MLYSICHFKERQFDEALTKQIFSKSYSYILPSMRQVMVYLYYHPLKNGSKSRHNSVVLLHSTCHLGRFQVSCSLITMSVLDTKCLHKQTKYNFAYNSKETNRVTLFSSELRRVTIPIQTISTVPVSIPNWQSTI